MRPKEMTVITGDINSSYGSSLCRRPFFPRQVVVAGCKTAGLPPEEGHAGGPVGLCACHGGDVICPAMRPASA